LNLVLITTNLWNPVEYFYNIVMIKFKCVQWHVLIAMKYTNFLRIYDRIHHFGLILKFWPNECRNSSVTHYPKFLLFRPFKLIAPKVIEFCLLYSNISLVPSFKPILKFWLMIRQDDYTLYNKSSDSS
jgi:hypothetical protein